MSITACDHCGEPVNTDDFPEAFVEKPNYTNTAHPVNPQLKERVEYECVCESCQEIDDLFDRSNWPPDPPGGG